MTCHLEPVAEYIEVMVQVARESSEEGIRRDGGSAGKQGEEAQGGRWGGDGRAGGEADNEAEQAP